MTRPLYMQARMSIPTKVLGSSLLPQSGLRTGVRGSEERTLGKTRALGLQFPQVKGEGWREDF